VGEIEGTVLIGGLRTCPNSKDEMNKEKKKRSHRKVEVNGKARRAARKRASGGEKGERTQLLKES